MICFYAWGTKINGGVQSLIINQAKYFANHSKPVTIIGYDYCFIVKTLNERDIKYNFIDIERTSLEILKQKLKGKVLILTSFHKRFGLKRIYKANPKVLFWNVFPSEIINTNKLGPLNLKSLTSKLIDYLDKNEGCVYMDGFCYNEVLNFNERLNLERPKEKYLPIPVKVYPKNQYIYTNKIDLNISYIGRGTIWKIHPLIKFIYDIKINEFTRPINIYIISQEKNLYYEKLKAIILPKNIKIFYKNNLTGSTYFDFLKNKIDLNISMGTAALDSASLGIPTILIDYSHTKMPENYKYNWLFETEKFGLADNANNTNNKHVLDEILQPFKDNNFNLIENLSDLCYDYVKLNHSIENISLKLVEKVNRTNAEAMVLYKYSPLVNNFLILKIIQLYNNTLNRKFTKENT
jgi:hypothetical protein